MKTEHKTTVWERVRATATQHGAAIDEEIDRFTAGGYKSKFSAAKYIKGYELSGPVVKILAEFYRPHLNELLEAQAGTDPELRGCYLCTDKQLARYIEFMQGIVDACDVKIEKAAVERKPRAHKVKPPEVLVAKMKHLESIPSLNILGHPIHTVIEAQEAWFFDAEKRKLLWYKALDRDGLTVKGTTILNFDEKTSGSRPIRKPPEFFKDLVVGCRGLTRAWSMIRGKVSPIKGRTNDNMVLLAVG